MEFEGRYQVDWRDERRQDTKGNIETTLKEKFLRQPRNASAPQIEDGDRFEAASLTTPLQPAE